METQAWRISSRPRLVRQRAPEDEGAPSWWVSDEEASQSFMRAMGV